MLRGIEGFDANRGVTPGIGCFSGSTADTESVRGRFVGEGPSSVGVPFMGAPSPVGASVTSSERDRLSDEEGIGGGV